MFGFTEEQISDSASPSGSRVHPVHAVRRLQLARESKAGRLGTIVLFFVHAFGMLGFIAKSIIQKILGL